jgi:hypothetical protein
MSTSKDIHAEISAMRQRIAELECRQRRLRWFGLGAIGVALALFVGAMTGPSSAQGSVTVAQRIDITDPTGKQRAVLGFLEGIGPALVFYSDRGEAQMMLAGQETGPALFMYDQKRKLRIRFELNEAIGPSLVFSDPAGRERAILAVVQEAPGLSLYDAAGKPFWKTP